MEPIKIQIEIGLNEGTRKLALLCLETFLQVETTNMANGGVNPNPATVLANLQAEVANNTTIEGSISTLIDNLVQEAAAAAPGNLALANVLGTLQANDANLAALVLANTPVASPAPVIPPPATPAGPPPRIIKS